MHIIFHIKENINSWYIAVIDKRFLSRSWVSGAGGPKRRDGRQGKSDADIFNENAKSHRNIEQKQTT